MKKPFLVLSLLTAISTPTFADVSISHSGIGDAILIPYYTVKNDMNTTLSVTNHSESDVKMVQLAYRESRNNKSALYYNVFLPPNSTWAVGLAATTSTILEYEDQPNVVQLHNNELCAPGLSVNQEFLPWGYSEDEAVSNNPGTDDSHLNLERVQEGYIDIYELGTMNTDDNDFDFLNCDNITSLVLEDVNTIFNMFSEPTGEISASASLLNVNEGTSYPISKITFNGFFSDGITNEYIPTDIDLSDASSTAIINHQGKMITTTWENGEQAISALLSAQAGSVDYSIEQGINAQTEVVMTFPTKVFFNTDESNDGPFTATYDLHEGSCESAKFSAYGRSGETSIPQTNQSLCWGTQVIKLSSEEPSIMSDILQSQHQIELNPSLDSGVIRWSFDEHSMTSLNSVEVQGLPFVAVGLQRYTNASAADGVLAQYGNAFVANKKTVINN